MGRLRHPAEDSSLCLDHLQAYLLKLWEIGPHAILRDKAVIASIIGFSDSGVDTDLGGHSGDDELLDGSVLENRMLVSGKEGTFSRLINHGFGRQRIEFWNDVVAGFAAHQDAAHGTNIPDTGLAPAADLLCPWEVAWVRTMAAGRVRVRHSR